MFDSIYAALWLKQFESQSLEFLLFLVRPIESFTSGLSN